MSQILSIHSSSESRALTYNQDEFRSVLDETVIIAIVGDYDLALQYDEARGILEALSKDAIAEDPYAFNPAGLDGHTDHHDNPEAQWSPQTDSCNSPCGSKPFTDFTEPTDFSDMLSERFESLELPDDVNISTLDEDGKLAELKIMFPSLRELDLRFALKKADGDFIKTCEELLNTQYLEDNGLRPKGIEGAFRDDRLVGGHKKGKKHIPTRRHPPEFCFFSAPLLRMLSVSAANPKQAAPTPTPPKKSPARPRSTSDTASGLSTSNPKTRPLSARSHPSQQQ